MKGCLKFCFLLVFDDSKNSWNGEGFKTVLSRGGLRVRGGVGGGVCGGVRLGSLVGTLR